jgi:hypothetical protein
MNPLLDRLCLCGKKGNFWRKIKRKNQKKNKGWRMSSNSLHGTDKRCRALRACATTERHNMKLKIENVTDGIDDKY